MKKERVNVEIVLKEIQFKGSACRPAVNASTHLPMDSWASQRPSIASERAAMHSYLREGQSWALANYWDGALSSWEM
jgi:hypothetical protein